MPKNQDDIVTPGAAALILSMRSFGYSAETSVADLIDNSITAGAKKIDVHFHWQGKDSFVTILDDAAGMDEATLVNAMRLGATSPSEKRDSKDLGRFGLGLKTASFSQAKMLTVGSKRSKKETVNVRRWDIDYVEETDEWSLQRTVDSETEELIKSLSAGQPGTLVIWQKLDRLVGEARVDDEKVKAVFYATATRVRSHLEMVFHRFLTDGLAITVNGTACEAWDPFLKKHGATARVGDESREVVIPDGGGAATLKINAFVLPHNRYLTDSEHQSAAGPRGWNLQQGFYLYRAGRLIVSGGDWWSADLKPEEHYKLGRVEVEITQEMDADWDLDVRKSRARPPTQLRAEFRRIAQATRTEAQKVYRALGQQSGKKSSGPTATVWMQSRKNGAYRYDINRDHPMVQQVVEATNQDNQGALRAALRLIEDHLPVGLIVSKFYSNEKEASEASMQTAPETLSAELIAQADAFFQQLCRDGLTEEEARARLMEFQPFDSFPEVVGALEKKD